MSDVWNDLFDGSESVVNRTKSTIFGYVFDQIKILNETKTQTDIAKILKLKQPHVSEILQGRMSRLSLEKLIELAERLELVVELTVHKKAANG